MFLSSEQIRKYYSAIASSKNFNFYGNNKNTTGENNEDSMKSEKRGISNESKNIFSIQ